MYTVYTVCILNVYYMYMYTLYMSVSSPTTHALVTLPWVNYEMLHTIHLLYNYTITVILLLYTFYYNNTQC